MREKVERFAVILIACILSVVPFSMGPHIFSAYIFGAVIFAGCLIASAYLGVWGEDREHRIRTHLRGPTNALRKAFEVALTLFIFSLGVANVASFLSGVIILLRQVKLWLKEGYWQEMDFLWLASDRVCLAQHSSDTWMVARDYCRPDSVFVTDWVGANAVVNWILDLHLAFAFALACVALYAWAAELLDN
ncbi:hypothetical protein [Marinovum sp.]|uniref:hypothetical protein n=1 Tax=Marinovum sp. TaxID=2024839 RepID=UPI002B27AB45|nr:hypothetical protein [Marinovum sp.]